MMFPPYVEMRVDIHQKYVYVCLAHDYLQELRLKSSAKMKNAVTRNCGICAKNQHLQIKGVVQMTPFAVL